MPSPLPTVVLTGRHVRLEPLDVGHVAGLTAAATVDRATYGWTHVPADADAMLAYVERLRADHAATTALPFAQRRLDTGELVGCTRFMEVRWWSGRDTPHEVEIGGTWLAPAAQRTPINTEAKLLLLTHAFEDLDVWRVAICTDERNERSRAAILRIGARFEGILRSHRPAIGTSTDALAPRNSAMFSIIGDDWPRVRDELRRRLTMGSAGA